MQIDITNGKRFNEYAELTAISSENDIVLVRLADGTGVKALPLSVLKSFITGDLSTLETEDKTGLIAAINEVLGLEQTDADNIKTLDTLTKMLTYTGASRANSFIVEQDLGTEFTDEQSADIKAGTFDLVRTGGYWTINGTKYWAAHADYRLNCGDTQLTTHHMLVVPDKQLYTAQMNTSNTTNGGYYGSAMKTSNLADALAQVQEDFGSAHILSHRMLLTNAVSSGLSSGWSWYDSQIDLMNEQMVYGSHAWGGGSQNGYDTGIDKSRLALFAARPDLICCRQTWWLRDVRSATNFCDVYGNGHAANRDASNSIGVRPAFLIY